ncbi:MAG: asparagine synthase (glutamine-hydrolyzing) [Acidobacteriota bacterium]
MCGISVVFDRSSRAESVASLLRLHGPIEHRGPDGEGVLLVDRDLQPACFDLAAAAECTAPLVGVAFRRLKILDLSAAAAQPMASSSRKIWIAFNGEIYNFRELRAELAAKGHTFRSSGDTEVVLAAYEEWGEDCFPRLEGMWAIVIVDLERRRLVVSRDRFGIKPLYWALSGGRFLLASEAKQILNGCEGRPRANAAMIRRHLDGERYPMTEETFFEGIESVPAGCWFGLSLDDPAPARPSFQRYWDLSSFHANGEIPDYDAKKHELRELLEAAVENERIADVPLGALLSGGLDSSLLTALLLRSPARGDNPLPTVSLGFRDAAPEFCELRYVDAMKRRPGLSSSEVTFDAVWVARNASRVLRAIEEPPLAFAALAQFRTFEACRERGLKVVIDGQGADEIFGGYPLHERLLVLDRLRHGRIGSFFSELDAIAQRQHLGRMHLITRGLLAPSLAGRLPRARWIRQDYERDAQHRAASEAEADQSADRSMLNRRLHFEVKWGNVRIVLGYGDRSSMAHSVEARVPFFDRRIVELAFSLPDSFKIGRGDRKRILRDVARDVVPPEITERADRMGFASPESRMIRETLWPEMRRGIRAFAAEHPFIVDRTGVERLIRAFESGSLTVTRPLWRLYATHLWQAEFSVDMARS